jgi:hypothetical protein
MLSRCLGVLIGLSLLAGCGASGKAEAPVRPTRSVTVTPSATVEPDTKAGALAFVRRYVEMLNRAQATGDVSELRRLSSSSCVTCGRVARSLASLYSTGGHLEGGTWTGLKWLALPREQRWAVVVLLASSRQLVFRNQKPVQVFRGSKRTYEFVVSLKEGQVVDQWSVVG